MSLFANLDVLVVLHDPAVERLAGFDAFDHDDADPVAFLVNHEMDHRAAILFGCSTAAAS